MFRIVQVLNNNVAIVKDSNHQQAVVMGKGIVFNKKIGDIINHKNIDRLFISQDISSLNFYAQIPNEFASFCYQVLTDLIDKYDLEVGNYIYLNLTLHLYQDYNSQENFPVKNNLPDLSKQYSTEYRFADELVSIFSKQKNITFPERERDKIALDLINS